MRHISQVSISGETPDSTTAGVSGINHPHLLTEHPEHTGSLEKIIDAIPAPVFFTEAGQGNVFVNRAFKEAFGSSVSMVIDEITACVPSAGPGSDKAPGAAGGKSREFSFRHSDGTIHYLSFNISSYCLPDAAEAGVLGVINDMTAYRQMEAELRDSQERYKTLFEESSDGFFQASADGTISGASPAVVSLLGYASEDELRGVNCADICAETSDRKRFRAELADKRQVKDFDAVVTKKDGSTMILSINARAIEGKDREVSAVRGVIRDITRHKQVEEQLLHSQKMEAIGKLTGGIAHDFNNMIMAITGYATLVRSRLPEGEQTKHYIEQLMDVADRASNLTRRLLAFGRKQGVSLRPVSLNEIVQRAGHLISRLIGERIEFVTRLGTQNFTVMADSGQMEQLLLNLAMNGRDAMAGSGTLTITTSEQTIDAGFIEANGYGLAGAYACLSVKDTGAGIDSDTLKRIFDPFFTTKDVGKGTGLGLSIVYGIVKQHSGFITVDSVLNEGTEFRILLPTVQARPRKLTTQLSMVPFTVAGKETVLLTEDDPGVREIARALLEESGYKVIEAVDGEDAVAKFNENRDDISLLLFDVMMPRKNGKEAYDEIKKTAPWIKVLFFSGYSEDVISTEGFFDPGANFISKPVPPHLLLKRVRMILDGF